MKVWRGASHTKRAGATESTRSKPILKPANINLFYFSKYVQSLVIRNILVDTSESIFPDPSWGVLMAGAGVQRGRHG